jgi:hypothetical protein
MFKGSYFSPPKQNSDFIKYSKLLCSFSKSYKLMLAINEILSETFQPSKLLLNMDDYNIYIN